VIILPNVISCDNVIIEAGRLYTKSIESNTVVAGNPAKMIREIDDYEKNVFKDVIFFKFRISYKRIKQNIKALK